MSGSFHRRIRHADLATGPLTLRLAASAADRSGLAARFGLVAIARLDAEMTVTAAGDDILVSGSLHAEVTQSCVRSLEPVTSEIVDSYRVRYVPAGRLAEREVEIDPEAEEDLDILEAEGVDLGELVAQSLSLALDPYPHRPSGACVDVTLWDEVGEAGERATGPFAVLKNLRDKS
ncbi:MAG: DUF177 domain-containing protein [Rhodothalassiaceae bacterium]